MVFWRSLVLESFILVMPLYLTVINIWYLCYLFLWPLCMGVISWNEIEHYRIAPRTINPKSQIGFVLSSVDGFQRPFLYMYEQQTMMINTVVWNTKIRPIWPYCNSITQLLHYITFFIIQGCLVSSTSFNHFIIVEVSDHCGAIHHRIYLMFWFKNGNGK